MTFCGTYEVRDARSLTLSQFSHSLSRTCRTRSLTAVTVIALALTLAPAPAPLQYMAPELILNQPYDYRVDIWALGILLYELMHGFAPFKGKTYNEIQHKIKTTKIKFASYIPC